VSIGSVLESGIVLSLARLRMFVLDLLWKSLYLISVFILVFAGAAYFLNELGSFHWQGPELTTSNPILLGMVAAELWKQLSGEVAWIGIGTILAAMGLCIFYEAIFRGGLRQFWFYAGSRIVSFVVIASAAIFLSALVLRDRSVEVLSLSAAIFIGVWFIVNAGETLVRRQALDLMATELQTVSGVMGILLGLHLLLTIATAAIVWFGITVMEHAVSASQVFGVVLLMVVAFVFAAAVHSYLLVVRYSAIDIMRNNVVEV